jgi:hypothetical protein
VRPAARSTIVLSLEYSSYVGPAHTLSFLYYEIGGANRQTADKSLQRTGMLLAPLRNILLSPGDLHTGFGTRGRGCGKQNEGDALMNNQQLNQLLYEALETEMGGIQVYESAIQCATNDELKEEWQEYLGQTKKHEQIVREMFENSGSIPKLRHPGAKLCVILGNRW